MLYPLPDILLQPYVDQALAEDLVKSKSCCKFTLSNPSQLTN